MKVFLLKDVPHVGIAGEVLKIKEGYGVNFLIPQKLAVRLTPENESFYLNKVKQVENRKEVIATETSMLAERIKDIVLVIKHKTHEGNQLYAAINPTEIVDALAEKGVKISKSQVIFSKSVKALGSYPVTIKLSSKLQPQLTLKVQAA